MGGQLTSTPPDARTTPSGGPPTTCYVRERAAPNKGTYIRNFFGCENGRLVGAEGCTPSGVSMGHGYPMNATYAETQAVNGNTESCNCENLYGPPHGQRTDSNYSAGGPGCYVALSGFIALGVSDPT